MSLNGEFPEYHTDVYTGRFDEAYMDSVKDQMFTNGDWETFSAGNPFPTGVMVGGIAGGAGTYGADRIKRKIDLKKKQKMKDKIIEDDTKD